MQWIQSNFEVSIFKILSVYQLKQNSSPPLSALVGGFFKQKIERKTPRMRREERVNRVVCKAFQVKLSSTIIPRGLVLFIGRESKVVAKRYVLLQKEKCMFFFSDYGRDLSFH